MLLNPVVYLVFFGAGGGGGWDGLQVNQEKMHLTDL
jgi:hypothetical protein